MNIEQYNPSIPSQSLKNTSKKVKKYGHNSRKRDEALVEALIYAHPFNKKPGKKDELWEKVRTIVNKVDEHLESLSPTAIKNRREYLLKIYKQKENEDNNARGNNDLYPELERLLAELVALGDDLNEEKEDEKKVKDEEVAEKERWDELIKDRATRSVELLCQGPSSSKKRRIEDDRESREGSRSPKRVQQDAENANAYFVLKDFKDEIKDVVDVDTDYEMIGTMRRMEEKISSLADSNERIVEEVKGTREAILDFKDVLCRFLTAIAPPPLQ
ncbi:hypothetical protein J3Q64DRAFT_1836311 [Phycomyces blakesleeanus]|uniref:Uncharacterized protein n=2 Tax=Phycomyces blakesleeanus TaxID=4837 RepID=A0A162UC15_PHYB8|nr:hypothetical protein PHYBLDRAFT_64930 [Phycomyces blakesleeanus NRRL 1555(-)]OAD73983.1 hypothetical protein PHYBLDRAFT_64930 [Phycomyces blakesleeanus NRRL 1555(-)]|eukprot:XP_018292023.1 hypothetical protein PHYBLDRAFT_64930 [Phycomyces blakesleeanus NRRL 1555(-)]